MAPRRALHGLTPLPAAACRLLSADPDEAEQPGAGGRKHSRGTSPCVFVAWEAVSSSPLNLPPNQMDFMIV